MPLTEKQLDSLRSDAPSAGEKLFPQSVGETDNAPANRWFRRANVADTIATRDQCDQLPPADAKRLSASEHSVVSIGFASWAAEIFERAA
jgi:hypothetical protein